MSQRALPEVMSQQYLKSMIHPSQCNVEKNDRNGLHFMIGASLQLGPGNNMQAAHLIKRLHAEPTSINCSFREQSRGW